MDFIVMCILFVLSFIVSKRLRSTIKSDSRLFGSFKKWEFRSQGSLNVRNRLEKNGAG